MEREEVLLACCKQGDWSQLHHLLHPGSPSSPKVNINYKAGEPLREAITNNHVQVWTTLLDRPELDPNLADENGRTALHISCWFNKEAATAKLLSMAGLRPNMKDVHGNTALMMAAKYGTKGGIMVLLNSREIDINTVDNMGRGVEEMVEESWRMTQEEKKEMVEIIRMERRRREREGKGESRTQVVVLEEERVVISNMKQEVETKVEEMNKWMEEEEIRFGKRLEEQREELEGKQKEERERVEARQEKDRAEMQAKQRQEENDLRTKQVKDIYRMRMRQAREVEEMTEKQKQHKDLKIEERKARLSRVIRQLGGEKGEESRPSSPSSPSSDTGEEGKLRSSLMKEAECPICLQQMNGRIWQCESGHLVCEDCHQRPEVVLCPTCRATFMGRATAVEQIMKTLRSLAARKSLGSA